MALTPESFVATVKCGLALLKQLGVELPREEGDDEHPEVVERTGCDQDALDAARYRAWRDNMLARPHIVAKELAHALRDFEVDEAIDKLFR
ncbi:hypothetical protein D3C80_1826070 [compost metagenome]